MKKKNGFTLIELLAVILILGIIALIAIPSVTSIIKESKKSSFETSLKQLLKAAEQNCLTEQLRGDDITTTYVFENGKAIPTLEVKGKLPNSGVINVSDECKATVNARDDDFTGRGNKDDIVIVDGVAHICKRATLLHTETCNNDEDNPELADGLLPIGFFSTCRSNGYSKGDIVTYGNESITKGILKSGDAFDCDINGDGKYDADMERFYYVSDLYNTTDKKFDDNYAVLIYYNNTSKGITKSDGTVQYDVYGENWHGPRTAISELPTISQWNNVTLSNTKRSILAENNTNATSGGTLPTNFSYDGYAARLLTYQEVINACGTNGALLTIYGSTSNCEYLLENTYYSKMSAEVSRGYWLETPAVNKQSGYHSAWRIDGWHSWMGSSSEGHVAHEGVTLPGILSVRPAIEVLKSDIEY